MVSGARGRLRALVVAALLLPLAGCVGECGPTDEATWSQPGLYSALPAADERAPVARLEDAAFSGVPNATIESVTFGENGLGITLYAVPSPHVIVTIPEDVDDAAYAARVRGFLANVSASDAAWDRWTDALLAQRHAARPALTPGDPRPAGGVEAQQVVIEPPFRLGALAAELGFASAGAPAEYDLPGSAHVGARGWAFALQLPVRHVERDGVTLDADARDRALARVEGSDHAASLGKIAALTRSLGVGEPPLAASDFHTIVC